MTTLREAAQMALETLVTCRITNEFEPGSGVLKEIDDSITALRAALAQPEQEPVAWINWFDGLAIPHYKELDWSKDKQASRSTPLYTAPPQRKFIGLTDEEIEDACWTEVDQRLRSFAREIEAKLREKNA